MPGPVVSTRHVAPRQGREPGRAPGPAPLERFGAWLADLYPEYPRAYSVEALRSDPGPGWVAVPDVVAAMASGNGPHLALSPAVAGARLIGSLGYAAAGRPAVALATAGRAYDTGPGSLLMRLDDEALVDRIGVRHRVLAVAADDPMADPQADQDGVVVLPDRGAVVLWAASRIWATLDRLIGELHELTRYGRIPMWNLVADSVLGPAATAAGLAGVDPEAGFATGNALLDALVDLGAPIHRRATLCSSGPGAPVTVRGSCCLYFRQGEEKCVTCPLVRRD